MTITITEKDVLRALGRQIDALNARSSTHEATHYALELVSQAISNLLMDRSDAPESKPPPETVYVSIGDDGEPRQVCEAPFLAQNGSKTFTYRLEKK